MEALPFGSRSPSQVCNSVRISLYDKIQPRKTETVMSIALKRSPGSTGFQVMRAVRHD